MVDALHSQHTQSFFTLLDHIKASLVVSTYQAGKLVLLRANQRNQTINTHFVSLERPMGIAFNKNRLCVGTAAHVMDYFNLADVAPKIEPTNSHDAAFLPRRIHVTGNIDIHEMSFASDDDLWLVNTKMSCLCTLDTQYSVVPRWRPPFISGYDLTDRCHLNGLAMVDGKPKYVSALGTSNEPSGWRQDKAFGGMVMDIDTNTMIADGLSMPHSPRWYRNKLWVLESGAGELICIDENTGKKTIVAQVPGFCRGIDFFENYAIIGLSQVRETAIFAGLPLTAREQDRKCGVWVVDIQTGETVAFLEFTNGVQEIFSVQLLPAVFPAVLDFNDPLLQTSYSLPDDAMQEVVQPDESLIKSEAAVQLHHNGKLTEAIEAYQAILEEDSKNNNILYHLGLAYSNDEQTDNAIHAFQEVVKNNPKHAEAWNSLGHAYCLKLDFDEGGRCYDTAVSIDNKYATARFNRGCLKLKQGDFTKGWKDFEWRLHMPNFQPFSCQQPQWHGEDISKKTLLVHTEHGSGDAIQFARFLPIARARCNKLVIVCLEPLYQLFREMDCVDEVRLDGAVLGDSFDVFCPIMSLAGLLDITCENLPNQTPYLYIPKSVIVPELHDNGKLKIGLVWSGSDTQQINHHRSCPIEAMMKITANNDYSFYSLQFLTSKEDKEQLTHNNVIDLEPELLSYAHTGALIKQMDMVISVCTSVVHLSGALNVPSLVLLSPNADWRWFIDETQSTWYPNTQILRQRKAGDWNGLIKDAKIALETHFKPNN